MKVAKNFDLREFIPPSVWKKFGKLAVWFVNPKLFVIAQGEKDFLTAYYKKKYDNVKTVLVVINNWHYAKSGIRRWSGLRTVPYIMRQLKTGKRPATLTQHIGGMCNATDKKYYIVFNDGKRKEIPASEIRSIILKNQSTWMAWGLTTLESGKYAPTWVHGDCRPTGRKTILIVGDKK